MRIDTCVRHHPKDLEDYLVAWRYWMAEIEPTLGDSEMNVAEAKKDLAIKRREAYQLY